MSDRPVASRDVIIQTASIDAAVAFYEALGLTTFHRDGTIAGLESGTFRLFVERGDLAGPVFEIFVDDLAMARRDLVAAGCTVVDDNPAIPRCYVRDPFGLTFNLAER